MKNVVDYFTKTFKNSYNITFAISNLLTLLNLKQIFLKLLLDKQSNSTLPCPKKKMKFSEFIIRALSEKNGQPSSTRLIKAFAAAQWSIVITFGFIYVLISYGDLVMSYLITLVTILAAVLGISTVSKALDSKNTTKTEAQP